MKQKKQDFALGLTAIVLLALFLGTLLFIYPMFHARGRRLEILFPHTAGMAPLKPGSNVLLGGSLPIGEVLAISTKTLPPAASDAAPEIAFCVDVEIDRDIPIYGNCEIATDQPAIGGSGYVTITSLGTPNVPLSGPVKGQPPQSFSAAVGTLSRRLLAPGGLVDDLTQAADGQIEGSLMYKLLASLDDVNAMTRELRTQLNPRDQLALLGKFQAILDNLHQTTTTLREQLNDGDQTALLEKMHLALDQLTSGLQQANDMLKEDRPLVLDALTNIAHTTRTVDQELLTTLRNELDPASPTSLSGKAHTAMELLNASLADVHASTSEADRCLAVSRPSLEKTLANFQAMSEQLRLTSQEVLLNPSKLLWGPGPQRQEQLVVFQAARSFAEAASQLDDASGRLEAVLRTLPADGHATEKERAELQAIQDAVRASFQRFDRAQQVLWENLK